MLTFLILVAIIATAALLMYPPLANAPLWRATITPLASIIGSGFLVLGPILTASYGAYAPLVMAGLCLVAYLFGSAIRRNITELYAGLPRAPWAERLDFAASWVLAFAYIISVSYYLNLFGAFGVSLTPLNDAYHARLLTSAVFMLILVVGWTRGFSALERMEQFSVGLKLAIIAGLLVGLIGYFLRQEAAHQLALTPPSLTGWAPLMVAFGLIVTVQGFETSRYLGETYSAATRIESMRMAQGFSTAIYLIYIVFLTFSFAPGDMSLNETAIIDMMAIVAPILPALLVAAALSAQFSAAVADTSGSGGLMTELTRGRVSPRQAYAILVTIGLCLTWAANIFEIISYASRAFALYYALQAAIAAIGAGRQRHRALGFSALSALGVAIALFGQSVE
jgi:hypothetical protein